MAKRNIILAGIPRSGTTMICELLSMSSDVLALVEPMNMQTLTQADGQKGRKRVLDDFFQVVRAQVKSKATAPSKMLVGEKSNTFLSDNQGKRKSAIIGQMDIALGHTYADDFTLVVKHPNAFSSLLAELVQSFECFAVVRNPISVLASWHSLEHPLAKGRAPMAEAFDENLRLRLNEIEDDLERQVALLDWYYRKYAAVLPENNVIRYEDVVKDSVSALSPITLSCSHKGALHSALVSRNKNSLYDDRYIIEVAERLIGDEGHGCRLFYSKSEMCSVL